MSLGTSESHCNALRPLSDSFVNYKRCACSDMLLYEHSGLRLVSALQALLDKFSSSAEESSSMSLVL